MAFHPYSGPLKNPFNNIMNDDDEFGDFASAAAFPPAGSNITNGIPYTSPIAPLAPVVPAAANGGIFFNPIPDNNTDDEFGDFCGPAVPVQQEAPKAPIQTEQQMQTKPVQPPVKCQPNYDIDLETDLNTVARLPWNGMHDAELGIKNMQISEDQDLFGSTTLGSVSAVSEAANTLEDVFALDCPIEVPVLQPFAGVDQVGDTLTDDEFGDFAQADVSPIQENLFASVSTIAFESTKADPIPAPAEVPAVKLASEKELPKLLSDPVVSSVTIPEAQDDLFDTGDADPTFTAFSEASIEPLSICWDDPLPPLDIVDPVVVPVIAEDESEEAHCGEDLFEARNVEEQTEEPAEEDSQLPVIEDRLDGTMPSVSSQQEVAEDDFGDFADFQGAPDVPEQSPDEVPREDKARKASVQEEEDDDFGDFDDFAAAPPVLASEESVPPPEPPLTPENQIQRMLSSVFPLDSDTSMTGDSQLNKTSSSPSGALWSYVSQVDSTPALSFSWKHSSAQQRFLQSLRIDTILQLQNKKPLTNRWTPPVNQQVTSQPTSMTATSEISTERPSPNITLDLDFFMAGVPATGTPSATTNSLLESIERELLASPTAQLPLQPAPLTSSVHRNLSENELSDFFDHLQLEPGAPASRKPVVDLLQ